MGSIPNGIGERRKAHVGENKACFRLKGIEVTKIQLTGYKANE